MEDRNAPPGVLLFKISSVPDASNNGELSDVFGVGNSTNEAAHRAFEHAADLMFPKTG